MRNRPSTTDLEKYIDGECSPQESERIRQSLEHDPSVAEEARQLNELNGLLRATAARGKAPRSLHERVAGSFDRSPVSTARRAFILGGGGALAAGLAGLAFVAGPGLLSGGRPGTVETFFKDFETYLLKDKSIDIAGSSMVNLASWYEKRLPFALPPVASGAANGIRLVGGRLCFLLERQLASLSFETSHGPLVLYIMDAKGLSVPPGREHASLGKNFSWHRSDGHSCLVWKAGDLLMVMVGTQEVNRMVSIASTLVG